MIANSAMQINQKIIVIITIASFLTQCPCQISISLRNDGHEEARFVKLGQHFQTFPEEFRLRNSL